MLHSMSFCAFYGRFEIRPTNIRYEVVIRNSSVRLSQGRERKWVRVHAWVIESKKAEMFYVSLPLSPQVMEVLSEAMEVLLHCIDLNALKETRSPQTSEPLREFFPPIGRFPNVTSSLKSQKIAIGTKTGSIVLYDFKQGKFNVSARQPVQTFSRIWSQFRIWRFPDGCKRASRSHFVHLIPPEWQTRGYLLVARPSTARVAGKNGAFFCPVVHREQTNKIKAKVTDLHIGNWNMVFHEYNACKNAGACLKK